MLKGRLLHAEARQRVMAERDPLTGLYNRRSFDSALAHALDHRDGAALVLFDFDGFKAINDDHGHPVGDAVLRAVAAACQEVVRDGDCLARFGGDEFAVIARRRIGRRRAHRRVARGGDRGGRPARRDRLRGGELRLGDLADGRRVRPVSCWPAPTSGCCTASD